MTVSDDIRQRLQALQPQLLELSDDSHRHAGHTGHHGGAHFRVRIVSTQFQNQTRLNRQRMVKNLLLDLFTQQLHALSIQALTPEEFTHKATQSA